MILAGACDDAANAAQVQIDAMTGFRLETELNPAGHTAARGNGQRIEFAIRVAKALVANCDPNGVDDQDGAEEIESQDEEDARIAFAQQVWNHAQHKRSSDQGAKGGGDPGADVALFVRAFRAAQSPIGTPQPRRKGIGVLEGGLLLEQAVTFEGTEDESGADEDEKGRYEKACGRAAGVNIGVRSKEAVKKEKPSAQERQGEDGQKDGADFRRLGHKLILEVIRRLADTRVEESHGNCTCPGGQGARAFPSLFLMAIIAMRNPGMRSVNVAELKNQLSKYLSYAKEGEEVVIRDRNLPVAKLVPFPVEDADAQELLLVAQGKMRLPRGRLDLRKFWKMPMPRVSGNKAVQALLADRDEGW